MWTDREYELVKIFDLHRYDPFANPDKVGLGQCGCGDDMYYCDHSTHLARAVIDGLGLDNPLPQPPCYTGVRRNRCGHLSDKGRCELRPDHTNDHDYTLEVCQ